MKSIYIDVLVTVNIFVDFFLILCTAKCLGIRTSYKRLLLGSLAGGLTSLVALLPSLSFILNFLYDILGAALIIFIAFGKCNPKNYIKRVAVFFSFSFSFCGIMIFVYTIFRPKGMEIYNDVVYFNISPVLLIILTLVCYYILKIIKRLTKGEAAAETCEIRVTADNRDFVFNAKVDTGCNLKEPFSGNDVIIAEKEIFNGFSPNEKKLRLIPFGSLGGSGIIKGFKPQNIKINGRDIGNDVYIGMCENVIKGDVKALISVETKNKIKI